MRKDCFLHWQMSVKARSMACSVNRPVVRVIFVLPLCKVSTSMREKLLYIPNVLD